MTPIYKVLILLGYFFFCNLLLAQNEQKVDSLFKIINNTEVDTIKAINHLWIAEYSMYNDPKLTLEAITKAEKLYQKTKYYKQMGKVYGQKANYYYRQGRIDSSRHYLSVSVDFFLDQNDTLRAANIRHNIGILDYYQGNTESAISIMQSNIPVFTALNDSLRLGNTYHMIGNIFKTQGYHKIALQNTLKALKIHKEVNDNFRIAEDLSQIGISYHALKEYTKAIETFEEGLDLYKSEENIQNIALALNNIGKSNVALENYEAANNYFKQALKISIEQEYKANIARTYLNLGELAYKKTNYDDAITYLTKGYKLWQSISSPNIEADALLSIGKTTLAKKNYNQSVNYFNKSIKIADSVNDPGVLSEAYLYKSLALENLKQYKESLESFKHNKSFSDTIFTIENANATKELQIIYETEKKEQEIALQKNEIELLEQKAKINNLQRIFLGTGLGLAFVIFGLIVYGLRQKIKRNKLEKEKVTAELDFKKKELTTHALHLAKKNEVLEGLKQKAEKLKSSNEGQGGYQQLISTINFDLQDDNNWKKFTKYFEEVHTDFTSNVKKKYPSLTPNELRLVSLLKMNLSSKEIASMLNISQEGVKKARYRLRKKLQINTDDSLEGLILNLN